MNRVRKHGEFGDLAALKADDAIAAEAEKNQKKGLDDGDTKDKVPPAKGGYATWGRAYPTR